MVKVKGKGRAGGKVRGRAGAAGGGGAGAARAKHFISRLGLVGAGATGTGRGSGQRWVFTDAAPLQLGSADIKHHTSYRSSYSIKHIAYVVSGPGSLAPAATRRMCS